MIVFGDCDDTHAAGELEGAGHVGGQQQIGELSQLRHTDDRQSLTRSTGNKAFVHIPILVYQFWRDGGQQSLEEFGHLSPLHRRALHLFIQLFTIFAQIAEPSMLPYHPAPPSYEQVPQINFKLSPNHKPTMLRRCSTSTPLTWSHLRHPTHSPSSSPTQTSTVHQDQTCQNLR